MKLVYLRDCLSPFALAHPIRSVRKYAVGTISRELTFGESQEMHLLFHDILHTHTQTSLASSLLLFCKSLMTWLCY